jgi:low affinity Fe/Cu permease
VKISKKFSFWARRIAIFAGHAVTSIVALIIILLWLLAGPFFKFSDSWQLFVNTATTIITFLMVFLIQNTQNRDSEATQIKLDELIRAQKGAHNALLDLEELTQEQLTEIKMKYEKLAEEARDELRAGKKDTASVNVPD